MLITVETFVSLAAIAVMLLHWWLRGGRFIYEPVSRVGKIVQGVCFAGILAITVLGLAGRVGPDVIMAMMTAQLLLQVSHSSWRREHEHQRKSSPA
jgi:hypothetical protein